MPVKSLDELKAIRDAQLKKVKLRELGEGDNPTIEILVGMATCGIAAGSRAVLSALLKAVGERELDNIKIVQVGCMGYCHSEPTVQINMPGQEPVIYGNVTPSLCQDIVAKHILNDEILDDHVVIKTFNSAR